MNGHYIRFARGLVKEEGMADAVIIASMCREFPFYLVLITQTYIDTFQTDRKSKWFISREKAEKFFAKIQWGFCLVEEEELK